MYEENRCVVLTGEQISVYNGRKSADGSGFKFLCLSILSSITDVLFELRQFAST